MTLAMPQEALVCWHSCVYTGFFFSGIAMLVGGVVFSHPLTKVAIVIIVCSVDPASEISDNRSSESGVGFVSADYRNSEGLM